jgi:hypothetical protein
VKDSTLRDESATTPPPSLDPNAGRREGQVYKDTYGNEYTTKEEFQAGLNENIKNAIDPKTN